MPKVAIRPGVYGGGGRVALLADGGLNPLGLRLIHRNPADRLIVRRQRVGAEIVKTDKGGILLDTPDGDLSLYVDRIRRHYPTFPVRSVRRLEAGQNNDLLVLNDAWVFRFPHHRLGAVNLQNEAGILRSLQGRLPLQIPQPEYVYVDSNTPSQSFMGYAQISGIPLTKAWVDALPFEDCRTLLGQLEDFLCSLHRQTVASEFSAALPTLDCKDYWAGVFERIQRLLFDKMRPDARTWTAHHFEVFLQNTESIERVLIHGDFGGSNILIDGNTKRAVAIIDFDSIAFGDPAIDYAALSTIHPQAMKCIEQRHPQVADYTDRIAFYRGTFALQEALYGAEANDQRALWAGLQGFV